jgi:TPR repeat protein
MHRMLDGGTMKKLLQWMLLTVLGFVAVVFIIAVIANRATSQAPFTTKIIPARGAIITIKVPQEGFPEVTVSGGPFQGIPLTQLQAQAQAGNATAQRLLGSVYWSGTDVTINGLEILPQDYSKAVQWYQRATMQGDGEAQYFLGYAFQYGQGLSMDLPQALQWYHKAAAQNDATAQAKIGVFYERGLGGLQKDDTGAVRWFRLAAERGEAGGQVNLGVMYYNGAGVSQNFTEALKWFLKSAEQHNEHAQFLLGRMYEQGQGVVRNMEDAISWYRKAAEQGHQEAKMRLESVQAGR